MMRALAIPLVLVASSAVIAAGCGSGGGGTTTTALTKAEYAAQLDSICAATNKAGKSLDLTSVDKIAANGDKGKVLLDKMVQKIESLEPPDAVKTQAQSFVAGVRKEADDFGNLVQAAKNGDAANVQKIAGQLASETTATSEDARFVGAKVCARLL